MHGGGPLEAKVETDGEVAGWRGCLEIRRRIARRPECGLGIRSAVFRPQEPQVSGGECHRHASGARQASRKPVGSPVRQLKLTEANGIRLLEVSGHRSARMLAQRDGASLLVQRGVRVEKALAVEASGATNALGVVVLDMAPLVVEHARDPRSEEHTSELQSQ